MRVGLYVQNLSQDEQGLKKEYERIIKTAADSRLDLLVFPEHAWCPGVEDYQAIDFEKDDNETICSVLQRVVGSIAKKAKCSVIFNRALEDGRIMSTFVGAGVLRCYYKHIATTISPFSFTDYNEIFLRAGEYDAIDAGSYKLGMTTCYDSTNPLLNRIWGLQDVDLIANSTGGHVDYKKWTYYQKTRAIENNCFTVCTMAYCDSEKKNASYAMGFDPWGRPIQFENATGKIRNGREFPERPGELYVATLDLSLRKTSPKLGTVDEYIDQAPSINKQQDLFLDPEAIDEELQSCRNLATGLYVKPLRELNVVYVVVEGRDIYRPELIQPMFYAPELRDMPNKRYVLINRWSSLGKSEYECFLSNIIRVRAAENYCACLLTSDSEVQCYQVGRNKNSQVVALSKQGFGIDLSRTSGPEAIWQTKAVGVHADWRVNYEKMVQFCREKAGKLSDIKGGGIATNAVQDSEVSGAEINEPKAAVKTTKRTSRSKKPKTNPADSYSGAESFAAQSPQNSGIVVKLAAGAIGLVLAVMLFLR